MTRMPRMMKAQRRPTYNIPVDPRMLQQLQKQTQKQKKDNDKTMKEHMREIVSEAKDVWGSVGKAKGLLGGIYNLLDSTSYYDMNNVGRF